MKKIYPAGGENCGEESEEKPCEDKCPCELKKSPCENKCSCESKKNSCEDKCPCELKKNSCGIKPKTEYPCNNQPVSAFKGLPVKETIFKTQGCEIVDRSDIPKTFFTPKPCSNTPIQPLTKPSMLCMQKQLSKSCENRNYADSH